MTDQESRKWLLYIFDCIALAVGNFGMLGVSKFAFHAEIRTDFIVVMLFMLCIRLLIVAVGDFTGFCDKLWHTVVIVAIAEMSVVIVEYVMVYGLSQRFLVMTAAADLILVMLVHIFWRRRQRQAVLTDGTAQAEKVSAVAQQGELAASAPEAPEDAAEDDRAGKVSWLLRGSVLDEPEASDAGEADTEVPVASATQEPTEEVDSGTALDWLSDDDDFETEGSVLFTSEDDEQDEDEPETLLEEAVPEPEETPASGEAEAPDNAFFKETEIGETEQDEKVLEPEADEAEPAESETEEAEPEAPGGESQQAAAEFQSTAAETASDDQPGDQTDRQDAAYRNVEDDLNDFIDSLSANVSDDVFTETAGRLKDSLEQLLTFRTDEPFTSTSRALIDQLNTTKTREDLSAAAIDNVITVAQQIESIEQVEDVIEAPEATTEKPVEAHRIKQPDYKIQDDEILLDSGDSEIIISKEDLEHIRRYMKNRRK